MVTLNKKESERFIRKMLETERRKMTKKEKEMAKGVMEMRDIVHDQEELSNWLKTAKRNATVLFDEAAFKDSSYVMKDGLITFRGNSTYKIDKLIELLKLGKNMKKGSIMCDMRINIPKMKGGKKKYGKKKRTKR